AASAHRRICAAPGFGSPARRRPRPFLTRRSGRGWVEIGRASCRERAEDSVGRGCGEKSEGGRGRRAGRGRAGGAGLRRVSRASGGAAWSWRGFVVGGCRGRGAVFFFSSRRRHTILVSDWSSDVCSSDLRRAPIAGYVPLPALGAPLGGAPGPS